MFLFAFLKNYAIFTTQGINNPLLLIINEDIKMAPRKKAKSAKKATARKSTKKVAAKTTTAKKKVAAKKAATKKTITSAPTPKKMPSTSIKDAYTKSQIITTISETTALSKKEIANVFDALGNLMERHLKRNAAGEFTIPGITKFSVKRKPATKARKGVNPFTGEEMMFKAKPACNVVKARPLKRVKDMAN